MASKSSLIDRLVKASSSKTAKVFTESEHFSSWVAPSHVLGLNIALSGALDGGLTPGITAVAAPSRHFKTMIGLLCAAAYMRKFPDAVMLFYDSEWGAPPGYLKSMGIDPERVVHCPQLDLEMFATDLVNQINEIKKGEHVIIFLDSLGNLASKKEAEDTEDGKSAADMTRAKKIKSIFRIVTPHLNLKQLPFVVVNHVYQEIGMFPKTIMGGGTGPMLAANNVLFISRAQDKDGKFLAGYKFNLKVEKSRYAVEQSVIPIEATFAGGINPYGGLLDIALEGGFVTVPAQGWYTSKYSDKKLRRKETNTSEFWQPFFEDVEFHDYVIKKYQLNAVESGILDLNEIDKQLEIMETSEEFNDVSFDE